MVVLVTLVIVARFCIRLRIVRARLGADDWCILIGWVLAVAFDLNNILRKSIELPIPQVIGCNVTSDVSIHSMSCATSSLKEATDQQY